MPNLAQGETSGKNLHLQQDVWSGAGNKSFLGTSAHVMDVRASSMHNLQDRFRNAKLKAPIPIIADITDAMLLKQKLAAMRFDHIICDVPCSGSGTWARTPEQFYFFNTKELSSFKAKQFIIANNSLAYLKEGGSLIYITCSIFKSENEAMLRKREKDLVADMRKQLSIGYSDMCKKTSEAVETARAEHREITYPSRRRSATLCECTC
jgi:16S rRNA (cytosine967-C5)-methyltransferase